MNKTYTLKEISKLIDINGANLQMIDKGCEMCGIVSKLVKGRSFVVNMQNDLPEEERLAKETIGKQVNDKGEITIISKVDTKHPRYSYYEILIINSTDMLDVKKAIKFHKMKAFI